MEESIIGGFYAKKLPIYRRLYRRLKQEGYTQREVFYQQDMQILQGITERILRLYEKNGAITTAVFTYLAAFIGRSDESSLYVLIIIKTAIKNAKMSEAGKE